ncbi:MAG: hypothetical protein AB8B91_00195 [Rubripirellula sp.]
MLRQIICSLDYSGLAEVAMALFATAFILILVHTLRTPSILTDHYAAMPLSSDPAEFGNSHE